MLSTRFLTNAAYVSIFVIALSVVIHDVWVGLKQRREITCPEFEAVQPIRWRTGLAIMTLAWLPLVVAIVSGGF